MFGLFGGHKKIGKKTGEAIKDGLFVTFKVYDQSPSKEFFKDRYIYGFIHASVSLLLKFVTGNKNWSMQKKGEAYAAAIMEIDPSLTLYNFHSENVMDTMKFKMLSEVGDFKNGSQDATTLIGVTYGFIKPDDPDPIYQGALKTFKKTEGKSFDYKSSSDKAKMGGLVASMTINHYIKKKYIEK